MMLDDGGEIEKGAEFYWLNAGKSTRTRAADPWTD
jgi:hypothetical protein